MAHLRPCSACARHVRADVTACPFCEAPLAIETATPPLPQERLGRAARMAFGGAAAVALTVAACDPPKENIAMPYGAPPDRTVKPETAEASVATETPVLTASAPAAADATAPATDAASAPTADAGKPVKPPPAATGAVKQRPPHGNVNKPYGAPPADGYDVFDV